MMARPSALTDQYENLNGLMCYIFCSFFTLFNGVMYGRLSVLRRSRVARHGKVVDTRWWGFIEDAIPHHKLDHLRPGDDESEGRRAVM